MLAFILENLTDRAHSVLQKGAMLSPSNSKRQIASIQI